MSASNLNISLPCKACPHPHNVLCCLMVSVLVRDTVQKRLTFRLHLRGTLMLHRVTLAMVTAKLRNIMAAPVHKVEHHLEHLGEQVMVHQQIT